MLLLIMNNGNYVVKGGYWDGRIAFCPIDTASELKFELKSHQTTVSSMACNSKESVMITGAKSGEVIVWRNKDFEASSDNQMQSP